LIKKLEKQLALDCMSEYSVTVGRKNVPPEVSLYPAGLDNRGKERRSG
jgi:hypothetical protein